jgi:hypothetical protein
MGNQQIAQYLQEQCNDALAAFRAVQGVHPRFQQCFTTLQEFDFTHYRQQLRDEILQNVKYWQQVEGDIEAARPLDALLLGFNSIYEQAVDAHAYGIVDWQDATPHTEGFDMGFDYDFRKQFYSVPGISLDFLQPLEELLAPETIHELADPQQDMEDVPSFRYLADATLFSGLVPVHEVLVDLDQQQTFAQIGLKPSAQFLLGGHDTGVVYPLLFTSSK